MPALLGHPLRVFLWTAKGAALLHVAFAHGYSAAPGWGPSMLPTFLVDGQWFAVDRGARRGRGVAVGDCVLYAIPVVGAAERRYVLCFIFILFLIFFFFVKYIYKICIGRSLCNYSSSGWEAFFSSASTKPCTSYGDERRCTREGFACFLDCIFLCSKGRGEGDPSSHRMRPPKLFVHLSGKRITYPHIANQPQTS